MKAFVVFKIDLHEGYSGIDKVFTEREKAVQYKEKEEKSKQGLKYRIEEHRVEN